MPVVFVACWDQARSQERTVYMLALPRRDAMTSTWSWDELAVRESPLHGLGVYPVQSSGLDWTDLRLPLLLPYLGAESVVEDSHLHKCLIAILHGEFSRLTVGELRERHGGVWVRNGLCAVRRAPTTAGARGAAEPALADDERLLQVSVADAGASVCYLLEADARSLLHLQHAQPARARAPHGGRAAAAAGGGGGEGAGGGGAPARSHGHLFELLAAHERLQHCDRHLGTHLATIRREEGWVIVNAHPALGDGLNIVGIINEPPPREKPTLKLVHRSVELLPDDSAELRRLGLRQPRCAEEVWRAAMLPHDVDAAAAADRAHAAGEAHASSGFGWRHGERMVVYLAARRSYPLSDELTVDYGRSYKREYATGCRKPHAAFAQLRAAAGAAAAPAAREAAALLAAAAAGREAFAPGCADEWPHSLRGWWNPSKQPVHRPAFEQGRDGWLRLLQDQPHLVQARRVLADAIDEARAGKGGPLAPRRQPSVDLPPRRHPLSRAAAAAAASAAADAANAAAAGAATPTRAAVVLAEAAPSAKSAHHAARISSPAASPSASLAAAEGSAVAEGAQTAGSGAACAALALAGGKGGGVAVTLACAVAGESHSARRTQSPRAAREGVAAVGAGGCALIDLTASTDASADDDASAAQPQPGARLASPPPQPPRSPSAALAARRAKRAADDAVAAGVLLPAQVRARVVTGVAGAKATSGTLNGFFAVGKKRRANTSDGAAAKPGACK